MNMNALIEKKAFVGTLVAGQQVQDVFLISRKLLAETKAGKPYLALGLMDKSGEIEARLWDNAQEYDGSANEGAFVMVRAVVKSFRDQLQLAVQSLETVAELMVDLADFMPASIRPLTDMANELEAVIAGVGDPGVRALLEEIFQGETLVRFTRAPAAKKLHHAYIGGLIEHSLSIVGMVEKTAAHYPLLDRDLLIAGALLHDCAKIEEYSYSRPPFDYTDRGRLVGHLVLGVELVRKAADKIPQLTAGQVDQVMHLILSHHGQLEFGSPVLPMTPEAIVLSHLDDMDAKMNSISGLQKKMAGSDWQWSAYQRHLDRYLYLRGSGSEEERPPDDPQEDPSDEGQSLR